MSTPAKEFEALSALVEYLRGPDGCPWDRRQTHDSLLPYLLEETYEVVGALDHWAEKPHRLREELGDLLLQVLLHSVIAAERGAFTLQDVLVGLRDKLIRRHPHVFGDATADGAGEVMQIWENIKAEERRRSGDDDHAETSVLDSVSEGLPPTARAYALQQQAAAVGFDWSSPVEALAKVREELDELEEALNSGSEEEIQEEAGDAIFSLINVIRLAGYHPDQVAAAANTKFVDRFRNMERLASNVGRRLDSMDLDEMDQLWKRVKNA